MTMPVTNQPEAPAPRRERPASLPPATPEDIVMSKRIFEAVGYVVSVVTGVLGGWDLFARNSRVIAVVAIGRGPGDPDLLGVQYLGPDHWPTHTLRVLHWYRGDASWPEVYLL